MRIVEVEDFFHPDAGYQVNILSKYFASFGCEVYILAAEMDKKIPAALTSFFDCNDMDAKDRQYEERTGVKIQRLPLLGYWGHRYVFSRDIAKRIRKLQPDVLYVHGNDTYIGMMVLGNIFKFDCPIVSDSHMLECAAVSPLHRAFCTFYRRIITPSIVKRKIPVIRTTDDTYVHDRLGIPLAQCPGLSFGSDTMLFHKDPVVRHSFREKNGIPDSAAVIVYAGKLDEGKGGEFLADALMDKLVSPREIVFVIVGNTNGEYGELVERKLAQSANRILRFGTQTYENLAVFFQMADIAVFPRQCSLSFFDVQACGLPVVFEDQSINSGRTKWGTARTFKAGDIDDFREKMLDYVQMDRAELEGIGNRAVEYIRREYDYAETAHKYLNVIESACREQGHS